MNIRSYLKDPSTKGRKVEQGFSLLRRCYDRDLVATCAQIQDRHRNISVRSDERGRNRLAIHTLVSGDILQHRLQLNVLGQLSVRRVLYQMLDDVPSLTDRWLLTVASLRMRQDVRDAGGPHYLEAVFDADGATQLQDEIGDIRISLQRWAEDDDPPFVWSQEMPLHLALAATGPLASVELVDGLEQTANELLRPPFQIEMTTTQLTLPRLAGMP